MESSPRQVYTRQVSKPYEGTVEKVIICEEGLASQGTIKYENEDGNIQEVTAVTNSHQSDFKEGERVKLIPL
ncbi:MAG TPA: hypothetical protein VJB09_02925 [Candidatus Paceibacterota bacterium]